MQSLCTENSSLISGRSLMRAVTTGAGCRTVELWVEGLSSFASSCSRSLEDLVTNEMQRNKEKNKIKKQTVRQCDSFAEISDAELLSSYLVPMCFSGSVFLCVQEVMMFPGVGTPH